MNKTKLKKLVTAEAKALKQNATQTELNNLDFTTFNPLSGQQCIYGQITGSCFNKRATALMKLCNKEVIIDTNDIVCFDESEFNSKTSYMTPIEFFVATIDSKTQNKNNKILIDYLKGKTKKLVFE